MRNSSATAALVWSAPALVFAQLLLAGLSIFHDASLWPVHGVVGSLIIVPVVVLAGLLFTRARTHLHPAALFLFGFYATQIALILLGEDCENGFLLALHAGNAGLVLAAGLIVGSRAAKRRGAGPHSGGSYRTPSAQLVAR